MPASRRFTLLAPILGLLLPAGCGARSHDPHAEETPTAAAPEPVPEPDPPAREPNVPDDPPYEPPDEPSGACDPRAACCRNRDCPEGQICAECPGCPGGLACGWRLREGCPGGELVTLSPLPNVMLLVDRSESMDQALERSRKWDVVREGLGSAMASLDGFYRFGLTMFPAAHGECGAPEIAVQPAERQADEIAERLADAEPLLATPLGDALDAMEDAQGLSDPERAEVVVLLTDGGETCGGDPVRSAEALVTDDPPVDLYVIAIGDDADPVADLGRAAGTGAALTSASTAAALDEALRGVLDRAVPCRIELGDLREGVEPSLYDEDGVLVPRDAAGRTGWRLASGGQVLELHGATCTAWRTGERLTLAWPCGG